MIRVGILGTENSHAKAFIDVFNRKNKDLYPDIEVVAVGGNYPESSKALYDEFNLEMIAEKPEDMLGKVDAIMVTSRDGKFHPEFAMPFVEAGLPAFIDKPFARDPKEALKLAQLAKKNNVPLVGGSGLKYAYDVLLMKKNFQNAYEKKEFFGGDITAPVQMHNDYGDFYFYASHLAETSMTIFGYNPKSVTASLVNNNITAIINYEDFNVTNRYYDNNYNYTAMITNKDRVIFRELDIDLIYKHECENFARMLRTGKMDKTYEELILPVYYLKATEEAYKTGKTIKIEKPVV